MNRFAWAIGLLMISLAGCAPVPSVSQQAVEQPLAFPGAEGFGRFTTGGRGGAIIVVTTLDDSGPGSLREAVRMKGPRTILFAVSGTIALESALEIKNGDVTIAGQSAPGGGICIRNYPVKIGADNVIIRYMRFRLGDERKVEDDALNGVRHRQIIIDHCSISWATDECASFYRNTDFTLQWCIISESLNESVHVKGEHGYGGIWGGAGASFHHNLIASHNSRLPRFSGSSTTPNGPDELVDFSNNVIYNWMGNNTYGGERGRYNVVNNYYKPGPATSGSKANRILNPSAPYGRFYVSGNHLVNNVDVTNSNVRGVIADDSVAFILVKEPFAVMGIRLQTAEDAYRDVLQYAGASVVRDAVDARLIGEVRSGRSTSGKHKNGIIDTQADVGGWPALITGEAPADADGDGMPDAWERAHQLNPADASDAWQPSKSNPMYPNLEVYLASRVQ